MTSTKRLFANIDRRLDIGTAQPRVVCPDGFASLHSVDRRRGLSDFGSVIFPLV